MVTESEDPMSCRDMPTRGHSFLRKPSGDKVTSRVTEDCLFLQVL